jgi:hypothetical protein
MTTLNTYPFAFKDALYSASAEYFSNSNLKTLSKLNKIYSDTALGGANDTNNKNYPNKNFILTKEMVMDLPGAFFSTPLIKFCTETCSRFSTLISSLKRDGQVELSPRETLIFASEVVLKPQYGKDFLGTIAAQKLVDFVSHNNHGTNTISVCSDTGFIDEMVALTKRAKDIGQKVVLMTIGGYGFGGGTTEHLKNFNGDSRDFVLHTIKDSIDYHVQNFQDQGFSSEVLPLMKTLYRYDKMLELQQSINEQLKLVMGENVRDISKKGGPLSFDDMVLLIDTCEFKAILNTKENNVNNNETINSLIQKYENSGVVLAFSGPAGCGKDYWRDRVCESVEEYNQTKKSQEIEDSNSMTR